MNEKSEAIVVPREEAALSKPGNEFSAGAIAAAEGARALVVAAYGMAERHPRVFEESRARILKACERPAFAERVEYSKPVGSGSVTGPSIRFAELALREWRNVDTAVTTIYEDNEIRRIQVTCTDLETNVRFGKQASIRKTVERRNRKGREVVGARQNTYGDDVYIVVATEEEMATKEAAVISKVLRNEGLRLIPADVVDEAIATAQATLSNQDLQDRAGSTSKAVQSFAQIGVTQSQLETYLGHPVDHEDTQFQELRGIYQAIKQGEAKWSEYAAAADVLPPGVDAETVAKMAEEAKSRGGVAQSTVHKAETAQKPPPAAKPEPPPETSGEEPEAKEEPAEAAKPNEDEDPPCNNCGQPWSEHMKDDTCPGFGPGEQKFSMLTKPQPSTEDAGKPNHPTEREF